MELINDFFKVLEIAPGELGFSATLQLNPDHFVYTGHFPGYPVTPGVIQLQIVQELLENHFGKNLRLSTLQNCKFLKILNPTETLQLVVHIELKRIDNELTIKARGENQAAIFFKLNAAYQFI